MKNIVMVGDKWPQYSAFSDGTLS